MSHEVLKVIRIIVGQTNFSYQIVFPKIIRTVWNLIKIINFKWPYLILQLPNSKKYGRYCPNIIKWLFVFIIVFAEDLNFSNIMSSNLIVLTNHKLNHFTCYARWNMKYSNYFFTTLKFSNSKREIFEKVIEPIGKLCSGLERFLYTHFSHTHGQQCVLLERARLGFKKALFIFHFIV